MEMKRTVCDAGDKFTIETCQIYSEFGFDCIWDNGKDVTLKKMIQFDNPQKSSQKQNTSLNKNNYSTTCRRCGRRLSSEESRNRGYGSYCYRQVASDLKRYNDNNSEQINFVDELKGVN